MAFLIKNCQLLDRPYRVDVRLCDTAIIEIGEALTEAAEESVLDAHGGLLLPGLHDHHIHLVSTAASLASIHCGPPHIEKSPQLEELLAQENQCQGQEWLRGVGYHMSVSGDIDRHWLDQFIPARPVRIQHRGGRLWILNTLALEALGLTGTQSGASLPDGIEYDGAYPTGRLYECDQWLRTQLNSHFPCLDDASQRLASYGVTGITDTTPGNGPTEWAYFLGSQTQGQLRQKVRMMGSKTLPCDHASLLLQPGEYKVHLLESQLPDLDSLIADIHKAHETGRAVAIHCVTHTELVFALACLKSAGTLPGDRIEHASVTYPEMLGEIAEMGLRVVSQPHFIYERGDQYLREVEPHDQAFLYRLRSFIEAGIPLAAGSDAPFGSINPWQSMQAAVSRHSIKGTRIGGDEALTPEMALALYTSTAENPGAAQRKIAIGSEASLCLLDAPWETVQQDLSNTTVVATWAAGELIYRRD